MEILSSSNRDLVPIRRNKEKKPFGVTDQILAVEGASYAYPVVDGVPVLLGPERLVPRNSLTDYPIVDLADPKYAEAYEEMDHYSNLNDIDKVLRNSHIKRLAQCEDIAEFAETFPEPADFWLDGAYGNVVREQAVFRYLAPVQDKVFLQLGGSGRTAITMLLAGARRAYLVTPAIGETLFAIRLASFLGVRDRFIPVLGVGEEIPFLDNQIDLLYSGSCFHHMRFKYLSGELHRVLSTGGKFAGVDAWKTFLHTIGIKMLGKQEYGIDTPEGVYCRPVTNNRLAHMRQKFPNMEITLNEPILRYLFIGLNKLSRRDCFPQTLAGRIRMSSIDDMIGRITGLGGGVITTMGMKE